MRTKVERTFGHWRVPSFGPHRRPFCDHLFNISNVIDLERFNVT